MADGAYVPLGCGKFFEGTGEEMHTALNVTLAALPDDTRVYVRVYPHGSRSPRGPMAADCLVQPGHEYTKSNCKFAVQVSQSEPVKALAEFAEHTKQTQGKFTIGDEKVSHGWLTLALVHISHGRSEAY